MKQISDFLVVTDLDQTLLDDEKGISGRNIGAINRFREAGGRFTIATGRSIESTRRYAELLRIDVPVIVCNGAVIYDYRAEKVMFERTLPASVMEHTYHLVDRFPSVGAETFVGRDVYVLQNNDYIQFHMRIEKLHFFSVGRDEITAGWAKVLFADREEVIRQMECYVTGISDLDAEVVKSSPEYLELMPKGINKGTGLQTLSELLEIKRENTAAVGDYYNDTEMIKAAGIGAAVENAPDDIKAAADIIVCHYQKGSVADLIEHIEDLCG